MHEKTHGEDAFGDTTEAQAKKTRVLYSINVWSPEQGSSENPCKTEAAREHGGFTLGGGDTLLRVSNSGTGG